MVKKCQHIFKAYFVKIEESNRKIIRSAGLIFLYAHMESLDLIKMFRGRILDKRQSGKISFQLSDLIISIILHILDGDKRFSHYSSNPNSEIFNQVFQGQAPQCSSYLWALRKVPGLSSALNRVLLRLSLKSLIEYCKKNRVRRVTIDMDQTARELHGKQQGVEKGYIANRRGRRCFQYRIWTVRETKMILRADLLPGSVHSSRNTLSTFKYLCKVLKKAKIIGIFVGDSGFLSGKACDLIDQQGHFFIFAEHQDSRIKQRGKNSKKKNTHYDAKVIIKERKRPQTRSYKGVYREIFIQVRSLDGQLWFDFAADKFTNVLISNCEGTALNIYGKYRGHAMIETIIEELKNDFSAGIAHSSHFQVNSTMAVCSALAYNIKNDFLEKTMFCLRAGEKMKLSTLQAKWLHTPGLLVKNGNQKVLKIGPERYQLFKKIFKAA